MRIFKKEPNFEFMNKRNYAFVFSIVVIAIGAFLFFTKGFRLGVDFTGGTMIEVSFSEKVTPNQLRKSLKKVGLGKSEISQVTGMLEEAGSKFFIKTFKSMEAEEETGQEDTDHEDVLESIKLALTTDQEKEYKKAGKINLNGISEDSISAFLTSEGISLEDARDNAKKIVEFKRDKSSGLISDFAEIEQIEVKKRVLSILKDKSYLGGFVFLSSEFIGPQVGHKLREQATRATVFVLIGMLLYIGIRFRFVFGFAAVITLLHDVIFCLSVLLLLNIEISLSVVAAILTIVGYSLNDTIVIFDRVRDNVKLMRRKGAELILDKSINQTLTRTIVTSSTTLATVLALYFFGGEVIHYFAFTLIVGIFVGTYSSIFQSCAWLKIWEKSFLGRKKI